MHRNGLRTAARAAVTVLLLALGGATAAAVEAPTGPERAAMPGCPGRCALAWASAIGFPTTAPGVTADSGQPQDPPAAASTSPVVSGTISSTSRARPPSASAPTRTPTRTRTPTPTRTPVRTPARTPAPAATSVPATPATPATPAPATSPTTAAATPTGGGASIGALQITPSGAARGGAVHLTAMESSGTSGTAGILLATGATAAAAAGTILVVRRARRRATGGRH